MPSPLTVARNDYRENPKDSTIYTPCAVADFIASLFPTAKTVLDPCSGSGRLLTPFRERGAETISFELQDGQDFLGHDTSLAVDLVVCNPPFNGGVGKMLRNELWLRHILRRCGESVPIALFTPMGMRLNQRRTSVRWRWMRDECPAISSILSLPLDIFPNVEFHAEVLFFNAPHLNPHYFLPEWVMNA